MRANLHLILTLPIVLLAFQNCGKVAQPSADAGDGPFEYKAENVVGSASGYDRIGYLPATSAWDGILFEPHALDLNFQSGAVSAGGKSCTLEADRLAQIRSIMYKAQLCEPGPLPPNTNVCLAIGIPDIVLSNSTSAISLRPLVCHNGLFLCEGRDQLLRDFLKDLLSNLPSGCQ